MIVSIIVSTAELDACGAGESVVCMSPGAGESVE
jgi:hypothetical protein